MTIKEINPTNLLAHWKICEKDPWRPIAKLPARQLVLLCYYYRMWIEDIYNDLNMS